MMRYLISENDMDEACELLDTLGIPYDFDGDDWIIVDEQYASEATEAWDTNYIDYDEI